MTEDGPGVAQFRTLGAFELIVDGAAVRLGGTKQIALLAKLALFSRDHSHGFLSKRELVDAIRLDDPVKSDAGYIDPRLTAIRQLRRADGMHLQLLYRTEAGFRLNVRPEQFDSHTFFGHLSAAQGLRRERNWVDAAARLRQLIAMWMGTPMPELTAFAFARRAADELDAAYIEAQIMLADINSRLGDHAAAVQGLSRLTADRPTDERLALALAETLRDAPTRRRARRDRARGSRTRPGP